MLKLKSKRLILQMLVIVALFVFSSIAVSAASEKPWMPGEPKDGYTHPGYRSIALKWKSKETTEKELKCKAPEVLGYRIYMSEDGKNFRLIKTLDLKRYPSLRNVQYCVYKATGLKEYKRYYFRIRAYSNNKDGKVDESSMSAYKTVSDIPVRPMIYNITAGGKTYAATGVRGGAYVTDNGTRINMARVSSASADYTQGKDYSRLSAENFMNDRGVGSETNHAVWVSTYTQHCYLFVRQKGKWKCIDDWHCSTGRAWSPTPSGNRRIAGRVPSRHGVPWWNKFQSWNSLHGRDSGWVLGRPGSQGCVRNPSDKAEKVYKSTKLHTRILIY